MKRILWIGSPFFAGALQGMFAGCPIENSVETWEELAASLSTCGFGFSARESASFVGRSEDTTDGEGWEICVHNFEHTAVLGWKDLVDIAGWEPDVVVVADKSRPPFVVGMEAFPCLTVFYCVDSHIHSWYPYYAQGFDVCLMSLRDHMSDMREKRLADERIWWFPAFAKSNDVSVPAAKEWDVLFVGTVSERTPKRKLFLEALGQRVHLHVTRGSFRELFPKGRIVLNYCEHGDLNFRVFEALGCESTLLTPRTGHGLETLLGDGHDCAMYHENDIDDAVQQIERLLADDKLREQMALSGSQKVNRCHRAQHRAYMFMERLTDLNIEQVVESRLAQKDMIREKFLRFVYLLHADSETDALLKDAYLKAASGKM